jgi:hypothetical protein
MASGTATIGCTLAGFDILNFVSVLCWKELWTGRESWSYVDDDDDDDDDDVFLSSIVDFRQSHNQLRLLTDYFAKLCCDFRSSIPIATNAKKRSEHD